MFKYQFIISGFYGSNLNFLVISASCLHQRCIITRPFMTGHHISKVSMPMGLLVYNVKQMLFKCLIPFHTFTGIAKKHCFWNISGFHCVMESGKHFSGSQLPMYSLPSHSKLLKYSKNSFFLHPPLYCFRWNA